MKRHHHVQRLVVGTVVGALSLCAGCSQDDSRSSVASLITNDDGLAGTHYYRISNGRLERSRCAEGFATPALCKESTQSVAYKAFQVSFARDYHDTVSGADRQRVFSLLETNLVSRALKGEQTLASMRPLLPQIAQTFDKVAAMGPTSLIDLNVGANFACGIRSDGNTYCWGANGSYQTGAGYGPIYKPTRVKGDQTFTQLAPGGSIACALDLEDKAWCWGENRWGALGLGTGSGTDSPVPVPVTGGLTFKKLAAGENHVCGLDMSGVAYCWGWNYRGQLGVGDKTDRFTPTAVATNERFISIAASDRFTCGTTPADQTFCWGHEPGTLDEGETVHLEPKRLYDDEKLRQVDLGVWHACGLDEMGKAFCWGDNDAGQLGCVDTVDHLAPTPVQTTVKFTQISAGEWSSCGIDTEGRAYCWGDSWLSYGLLGLGVVKGTTVPTAVKTTIRFSKIEVGYYHTCGLDLHARAYCWGNGGGGALGDGSALDRLTPTPVNFAP